MPSVIVETALQYSLTTSARPARFWHDGFMQKIRAATDHPGRVTDLVSTLFALLLLTGCGEQPLQVLKTGDTILAYGDSLTAGKGVVASHAYPDVLARLSGYTVINKGLSGETTAQAALRLPAVLDETQPALMLLMHGGNDILRSLDLARTKHNLQSMIDLAQTRGIVVVLVGIPEKKLFSSSAELYRELAKQNQLLLEESVISELLKKPAMKSDSVHFNQAGYAAMAKRLHKLLSDNGAY